MDEERARRGRGSWSGWANRWRGEGAGVGVIHVEVCTTASAAWAGTHLITGLLSPACTHTVSSRPLGLSESGS